MSLIIVPRDAWGSSPRVSPAPTNVTPQHGGTAIHWVGDKTSLTYRSTCETDCRQRVRQIQRHHIHSRGWVDIAYTMLVCPHGTAFEGRGRGRRTAANGSSPGNQNWYAVCALVGRGDLIGSALLVGLRRTVSHLRTWGAGPGVTGHRDHFNTNCPGDQLYAWVERDMIPLNPTDLLEPPSTSSAPAWSREITLGTTGSDVRQWQARLCRLGYHVMRDVVAGPQTRTATTRFQIKRGIHPASGVVTRRTWDEAWK